MKLLLDQNLSRKLVPELQALYPGSSQVYLLNLHTASDSDLWYYARRYGFTLATKNTDMVDLCLVRGAPPKVFWIRTGNCSTAVVRELLARNAERISRFEHEEGVVLSLFRLIPVK